MSEAQLSTTFLLEKPKEVCSRTANLNSLLPKLAAMLNKRGVTKNIAYATYILQYPDGYKSSTFSTIINAYMGMGNRRCGYPIKYGDKLFIDFTGKHLQNIYTTTGEVQDVEVFVAILGCSQLTYKTAVATQ